MSLGNVHSVVIPRRKKREDRFLNGGRVKHRALVGRTKAHVPLPSRIDISVSVPHMPLPSIVCQPAVRFENEDALHNHVDPPDSAHFHLQLAVQTELPHQQPQDRFLAGLRSTVQLAEHWDVHFRQLTEQRTELVEGKESLVRTLSSVATACQGCWHRIASATASRIPTRCSRTSPSSSRGHQCSTESARALSVSVIRRECGDRNRDADR